MRLRPYQIEAEQAVWDYWRDGGQSPLVEMATGTGKSIVIGRIDQGIVTHWRDMRILNLVHVRELVEQNAMALLRQWPQAPVGINSAALGRRDTRSQILFASIQSVYNKADQIGPFDLVKIDEAHLIPADGEGMYRKLLDRLRDMTPDMRVCGFTATPFRMKSGRLDEGEGALFSKTVYTYGVAEGIKDGWLVPLVSKRGVEEIDTSGVRRVGGEFAPGALQVAADTDELTRAAVAEMVERGSTRRSWLIFCAGVQHAAHVRDALREAGIAAETVTGNTPAGERARLVAMFKAGQIRALTNADVLTTGFDAPSVDMLVFLRSTLSASLYIQMAGRGTRPVWPPGFDPNAAVAEERRAAIAESSKPDCLVLDYAGNVRRHGPVDDVTIKEPGKGGGDAPVKECPACASFVHASVRVCPDCGHAFPEPERIRHAAQADTTPILSTGPKLSNVQDVPVMNWSASRHEKWSDASATPSVCVTYMAGLQTYREWVCPEHFGPARQKFERWWRQHGGDNPPAKVGEVVSRLRELNRPEAIQVRKDGKWFEIVGRSFNRLQGAA